MPIKPPGGSTRISAVQIGLVLLFVGLSVEAQDDPARFMFVNEWVGTFTRSFNDSGDGTTSDDCTFVWNYHHFADVTTHLVSDTASHPYLRNWFSETNDSQQVVLRERVNETCPTPDGPVTFEWTTKETDPLISSGPFDLYVNSKDGTYTVAFAGFIDAELTHTVQGSGGVVGPIAAKWMPNSTVGPTLPLPAAGYQLNGTVKFRARDFPAGAAYSVPALAALFPAYLDSDICL